MYGAGGELVFSGQDLSVGGALSYFHDVLYIALFVQALGCWTDKAWWTFALVRAAVGAAAGGRGRRCRTPAARQRLASFCALLRLAAPPPMPPTHPPLLRCPLTPASRSRSTPPTWLSFT